MAKTFAVNLDLEHETFGVHQKVSFPAADLLSSVVTAFLTAHSGNLDRLGVHYPGARLGVPL
jgi:hypothetical protein